MSKKWIIVFLIFVLIIFGFSLRSIADCKSDCQDAYDSEVDSCKTQYDDPDDADTLQMCIDNLRSEYQSCVDECENLDQADSQETKNIFSASMLLTLL
jgi:hypothetical protein